MKKTGLYSVELHTHTLRPSEDEEIRSRCCGCACVVCSFAPSVHLNTNIKNYGTELSSLLSHRPCLSIVNLRNPCQQIMCDLDVPKVPSHHSGQVLVVYQLQLLIVLRHLLLLLLMYLLVIPCQIIQKEILFL